jgi:radical SAM superfamily enzyme YgiQ (UPF0313 family)
VSEGGVDQRQLDEIKARYGIGGRTAGPGRFPIVLIKPSYYDDEGYVIQWLRSAVPSKSLAVIRGLVQNCKRRNVLGSQVEVEIRSMDEDNTHVRTERLARELKDGKGLVILVGVQSNHFARAMDLALPLRVAGVQVCMGGPHVSGSISRLGGATPELQEAMNLGISLFAGEAEEGRLDQVLRDSWSGQLKPLYNYLNDPPPTEGVPVPARTIRSTIGEYTSFDAGMGWPFERSSCTTINLQGQTPQRDTVGEVERIIRENRNQSGGRFFLADDNFSQNPEWERIFDRLIELREGEKLDIQFMLQADRMCHRVPGFIEKAARSGVRRVLIGIESVHPEGLPEDGKKIREYRRTLLAWRRAGVIVLARYALGSPAETPESVLRTIRILQKELAIDLLEPFCVTALPEADEQHTTMTAEARAMLYRDVWREFYSREHMETVLRRAAATGVRPDSIMTLLLWFHFSIEYEKIDPLQGGYLRRKRRLERRSTMVKEGWFRFWWRYGADVTNKHWQMARLYLRFRALTKKLERDRDASNYTDLALRGDAETDTNPPEMVLTRIG